MGGRGTRLPPDPAVITALIATSGDLVRSASEAIARAQRVCEQSRELVAATRSAKADGIQASGSASRGRRG
jgi:hypothetical protein